VVAPTQVRLPDTVVLTVHNMRPTALALLSGPQVDTAAVISLTCDSTAAPGQLPCCMIRSVAVDVAAWGERLAPCDADLRNVLRSYNVKLFAKSSFLALPSEKSFALYQPQNDTLVLITVML
jgi:hypothetical protein